MYEPKLYVLVQYVYSTCTVCVQYDTASYSSRKHYMQNAIIVLIGFDVYLFGESLEPSRSER